MAPLLSNPCDFWIVPISPIRRRAKFRSLSDDRWKLISKAAPPPSSHMKVLFCMVFMFMNTDDTESSGRPKSAVVPKNITKVHKIVLGDRKLKLREISDTLKISKGSAFTIMHESLRMRKFFSKWVPRLLTPDQNQQRVEELERSLELFKRSKKYFLRRYVTMDETWIHHYTTETKRSSAEWTAAGETCPK